MIMIKDAKILITGGAGFIGSNLAEYLINQGAHVRVLDNFSTGKHDNINHLLSHSNFELFEGDICDLSHCQTACKDIHYVMHQAALGSVPASIEDPLSTHEVNVTGTLNMLLASRDSNVKRFIYASSSAVYGDDPTLPKKEGLEGQLLSPYATSKLICEHYAQTFTTVYNLETVGLRYFNVFGNRQDPNSIYAAVIPIFVQKLLNNDAPTIHGDGEQSRDFVYIDNIIHANISAAMAPTSACGKSYNIACGSQLSLNQLYSHVSKYFDNDLKPQYSKPREGDIKHSHADISHARKEINYTPSINFEEGLEKCIEWYKNHL